MGWKNVEAEMKEWIDAYREQAAPEKAVMFLTAHQIENYDRQCHMELGMSLQEQADLLAQRCGFPDGCEIKELK